MFGCPTTVANVETVAVAPVRIGKGEEEGGGEGGGERGWAWAGTEIHVHVQYMCIVHVHVHVHVYMYVHTTCALCKYICTMHNMYMYTCTYTCTLYMHMFLHRPSAEEVGTGLLHLVGSVTMAPSCTASAATSTRPALWRRRCPCP